MALTSMDTWLIGQSDLKQIVATVGIHTLMDQVINSLEDALRTYDDSQIEIRPRAGFMWMTPRPGILEWMPAMRTGDIVTLKMVSYNPGNPQLFNIPTIIATNSIFDVATGHLIALMDGVLATAIRTGAASAIASKYMAAPGSSVVGLVGCGAQAVTQLHALSRVFNIERVLAHDVDSEVERSFLRRAAFLGLDVRRASLAEVEANADIICTATTVDVGAGPVIDGRNLLPSVHINAVGSDLPGKTELPLEVLERSLVCPDFPEQARVEGECQQLRPEQVGPSLVELVKNPTRYADWRMRSTVFDSTGFALEDQVITEMLFGYAQQFGLGKQVALENISGDVRDPYSLVLPRYGESFVEGVSEMDEVCVG